MKQALLASHRRRLISGSKQRALYSKFSVLNPVSCVLCSVSCVLIPESNYAEHQLHLL